jgi:hypothetical protein
MNILKSLLGVVAVALLAPVASAQQLKIQPKPEPQQAVRAKSDSPAESTKLEGRYNGPWLTTWNKKLDGTTNCIVKQLAADRWQGRFWGIWQQVPFDYTVEFERAKPKEDKATKPIDDESADTSSKALVSGKAMIDGASYDWTGVLTADEFNIKFTGSRYAGQVDMQRVPDKEAPASKLAAKNRAAQKQ